MMTDPIADMLTRIRNGSMARHERVEMPHSKLKEHVADVLKLEGYVDDVRVSEGEEPKTLTVVLRYGRDRTSAIDGIRRDRHQEDVEQPAACSLALFLGYRYSERDETHGRIGTRSHRKGNSFMTTASFRTLPDYFVKPLNASSVRSRPLRTSTIGS